MIAAVNTAVNTAVITAVITEVITEVIAVAFTVVRSGVPASAVINSGFVSYPTPRTERSSAS